MIRTQAACLTRFALLWVFSLRRDSNSTSELHRGHFSVFSNIEGHSRVANKGRRSAGHRKCSVRTVQLIHANQAELHCDDATSYYELVIQNSREGPACIE